MPKEPQKWDMKIYCLVDSTSKFVYDFDICCGRPTGVADERSIQHRESTLARDVVMGFTQGLEEKGHHIHHITIDNYFASIPLFMELAT